MALDDAEVADAALDNAIDVALLDESLNLQSITGRPPTTLAQSLCVGVSSHSLPTDPAWLSPTRCEPAGFGFEPQSWQIGAATWP